MSKRIFHEHIEQIWNNKDASGIERFIAPNYRGFDADEVISGIEGYKQHFVTLTTGFPDLRITIRDMQEENRVVARFSIGATHTGEFVGIPPTGRRVLITSIAIARISNGQLVEEHANADGLGLMKQLGVIPEPPRSHPLSFNVEQVGPAGEARPSGRSTAISGSNSAKGSLPADLLASQGLMLWSG